MKKNEDEGEGMAARHRPPRDYKGIAELRYIAARSNQADIVDTRSDDQLRAEIERMRVELHEAETEGCINVAYAIVDSIRVLKGRLARRAQ